MTEEINYLLKLKQKLNYFKDKVANSNSRNMDYLKPHHGVPVLVYDEIVETNHIIVLQMNLLTKRAT